MVLGYGAMLITLSKKSNIVGTSSNTSHVLVKVQFQVFIICFFVFAAALLYVYMQFFPVPPIFAVISQILWLNNFLIIIFMVLGYGAMLITLSKKSNIVGTSSNTSHVLVKVQFQVFIICFFVFAAALLYVYMQFFPVPPIFAVISQILWSFAQGCGGVIYITLNPTIRQAIWKVFFNKKQILTITHDGSKKERNVTERRVTTKIS
uniref:7TM_GPCR_Srx domain-containing protein n=1 Tax=Strongyloides papillosus TaxID=174720 RepID=A0A0N5BJ51_STREA